MVPYFRAMSIAALLALHAPSVQAHDFWIEPQTFRPAIHAKVPLRLFVGQDFKGEAALYNPEQFERYLYSDNNGTYPVPGDLGDDPAGAVRITAPGLYVVGYLSKKFTARFESSAEFEKYLAAEGLERNRALAKKRIYLGKSILETYTRCAKTLLWVGEAQDPVDRVLGFPLELITQPDTAQNGDVMTLQLRYHGEPLVDALVVAFNKSRPLEKIKARTDKNGLVSLTLTQPGVWLVTSVHMIPASIFSRADWESFWASLTFQWRG